MIRRLYNLASLILLFGAMTSCSNNKTEEYRTLNMVPKPKRLEGSTNSKNEYKANKYKPMVYSEESSFNNALGAFCKYSQSIHNIELSESKNADIVLKKDLELKGGSYRIEVKGNVRIFASGVEGINYALATMIQLMQRSGDKVLLPEVSIYDYPDLEYRGMMVDIANNWHEFEYLFSYVDMCYFYKIKVLHLHFTDNKMYTLPSDKYPELSTKGCFYTKEQINTLVEYANKREVEIMPEIDVPGHCESFQAAYPYLFGTDAIIHQHEDTFKALDAIFTELCDMFKYSKYIHIGGDEATLSKWTECSKCLDYAKSVKIDVKNPERRIVSEQMLANFVQSISDVVIRNSKVPIVWEGFAKEVNYMVSKDIIIMSWENFYQLTPDLLEAGFKIINCSWIPMYIVTPIAKWSVDEVFAWNVLSWTPMHPDSPYIHKGLIIEPNDSVIGGELLAWGGDFSKYHDTLEDGINEEMTLLLERLPALAENTWNKDKLRSFDNFIEDSDVLNSKLKKILKIAD